jgi:hypothetical protein
MLSKSLSLDACRWVLVLSAEVGMSCVMTSSTMVLVVADEEEHESRVARELLRKEYTRMAC